MGTKPGITLADFTMKKNWSKSLKIAIAEDNTVAIDCGVMIAYGHSVVDVAKAVQQTVTANVESMTGVKVTVVNVNVCGIVRD
jgi:uncharacterized alkaline shock family protein YloU